MKSMTRTVVHDADNLFASPFDTWFPRCDFENCCGVAVRDVVAYGAACQRGASMAFVGHRWWFSWNLAMWMCAAGLWPIVAMDIWYSVTTNNSSSAFVIHLGSFRVPVEVYLTWAHPSSDQRLWWSQWRRPAGPVCNKWRPQPWRCYS